MSDSQLERSVPKTVCLSDHSGVMKELSDIQTHSTLCLQLTFLPAIYWSCSADECGLGVMSCMWREATERRELLLFLALIFCSSHCFSTFLWLCQFCPVCCFCFFESTRQKMGVKQQADFFTSASA